MKNIKLIFTVIIIFSSLSLCSQSIFDPDQNCKVGFNDKCVPNKLMPILEFLRIVPDARSAGMGDVGLATSVDANSMFHNASKLAFVNRSGGASVTYVNNSGSIASTDIPPSEIGSGLAHGRLFNIAGFKRLSNKQSVGLDLRFFSSGVLSFTDFVGNPLGNAKTKELALSIAYARKLSNNFSLGITLRYAFSDLAFNRIAYHPIGPLEVFATDISFTYKTSFGTNELTIGTALTNLGSKLSYTRSVYTDFMPANFGLGTTYKIALHSRNTISFSIDFNKLLVPSPVSEVIKDGATTTADNPDFDADGNGLPDTSEKGTFEGAIESFTDAQGGFSEELKEITLAMGVEYTYDNQFMVRTGYFHESFLKGDRKYLTVGLGINYNVFGIDLSYLVPTKNRRSPLENTLRFSLNFNFGQVGEATR